MALRKAAGPLPLEELAAMMRPRRPMPVMRGLAARLVSLGLAHATPDGYTAERLTFQQTRKSRGVHGRAGYRGLFLDRLGLHQPDREEAVAGQRSSTLRKLADTVAEERIAVPSRKAQFLADVGRGLARERKTHGEAVTLAATSRGGRATAYPQ
jgi:hypothetical protein